MSRIVYSALAATVLLWASAFVGIRAALHSYSPGHLALLRYLIASLVLVGFALWKKQRLPDLRDVPGLVFLGAIGFTVYNLALNAGELTVTAASASFLVNTAPVFTALLAVIFLRERLSMAGWTGIGVSLVGAGIIAISSGEMGFGSFGPGAVLILAAALAQAGYFVAKKRYLTRYTPLEVTCYAIWFGTLLLVPFGKGLATAIMVAPSGATWAVVYLGLFPGVIGFLTYAVVLDRMPASVAAAFLYLVPVVTILMAFLWIGEVPSLGALGGGLVALAGVAILQRGSPPSRPAKRRSERSAPAVPP